MASPARRTTRASSKAAVTNKRYCGLGNHYLQEPHKTIHDPNLLKFAQRLNEELRAQTLICGNCLDMLQTVYAQKLRNALRHYKKKQASESISDVSSSSNQQTTSSESSNQQPTSTAAAAKRKHTEPDPTVSSSTTTATDGDDDETLLSLNAINGTRLPHIQPIPKRRQANLSAQAMDIYLAGTTGG